MKRKLAIGGVFAGAALLGALAVTGGTPAPERVGYFKSADGNRVMAYEAPPDMALIEARAFLGDVMHTRGQLTFAVIYPPGGATPDHRLTRAPDYLTAASMLDQAPHDGWKWGVVINANGTPNYELR